jgi:phage terminase large subunit GpA-like protein
MTEQTARHVPPRKSSTPIPNARGALYQRLARALRPRERVTVSTWADRHRILTSKSSSEQGRWRTARTPYLREIMDELSATSPTQRIVLMFATQVGKTEVGLNWIGYTVHHAPAPMLVVVPTLEVRKRWVRQRLDPLRRETPAVRDVLGKLRSRDATNSEEMFEFPGGICVLGGANSAASLASMPIRYCLQDEVDRFPWEVGQEGDPGGLIDERTKSFPRRKVMLVSTPTIKGLSRIEQEYERSDQRQFHVPCPSCGEYQVLRWKRDDGSYGLVHIEATGAVRYSCQHCGDLIEEHHKPGMLAAGRWIPRHPERKVRGYHLNALYAPIGLGWSWSEIWSKWQDAHGDTAALKRFVNTVLAETWEEQGDSIEDLALISRLEDYPDDLQQRVTLRTSFTDVQKDRLETTIVDWTDGEEAWLVDHIITPGDTATRAPYDALDEDLLEASVDLGGIDAGYNTDAVYAFCETRAWMIPTKGVPGMGRPLVEDEKKRRQNLRRRRKTGMRPEIVGVDQGKSLLYARLKLAGAGPGYVHFPRDPAFDDEYFAQLAAEKLVAKARGGRPYHEWVQVRPRNEALDCLVGNLAVRRLAETHRHRRPGGRGTTPPTTDQPTAQPRAARRGNYVNRWRR